MDANLFLIALFVGIGVIVGIALHAESRRARRLAQEEAARRRARKREAIKATIAHLRQIEREYGHDPDELRSRAAGAIAGLLVQLGCADVVDVWEWMAWQKK